MSWERNIDKAIDDTLKPKKNGYIIHREYMDTKRIDTKEYRQKLKNLYKLKYKNVKLDLILSSDNNAFDFLRKYRNELFGNVPVSFCGVNFFKQSDLKGYSNYTGIAEQFDAKSTVDIALKLQPKTKNIFIINDYLETGRAWTQTIKEQLKNVKQNKIFAPDVSISKLKEQIKALPKESIVLLGVYFKDKDGNYFTYEKIGKIISESSNVPVFCLLEFNIGHGNVVGGSVISGYAQGYAMSQIGKKILAGKQADTIPVAQRGFTKLIFDFNALKKYHLKSDKLPKNALIINKHISFYEKHQTVVLLIITAIIFLIFVIIILSWNIMKRKRSEALLALKQEEVNALNAELQEKINRTIKELEKEKNYLNLFYNNNGVGFLLVDENRISIKTNDKLLQIWGYSQEEIIGKSTAFLHASKESYKKFGEMAFNKTLHKNKIDIDIGYQFKKKDGTLFWARLFGEVSGEKNVLWIVTDITEIKEKEAALKMAKTKAEEATQLKSQFLANMSHEIRTPMNGIIGMLELASHTSLDERQKHYFSQVKNSANSLLNILNDILDFSKIEAGKLSIENIDFDMKNLREEIESITHINTSAKGLKFELIYAHDEDCIFYGDPLRIKQVLTNLLNNAIKFTHEGKIRLKIAHTVGNIMRFEVQDTGIGLSKEQQSKLFEAFTQADGSTTRKYGGTGLGLSISKQLVELMGGKIWVESQENVGSRFIFEIPLPQGNRENIDKKSIQMVDIRTRKGSQILLTEDNAMNQEIFLGLLHESGIHIDIANNGKEAVDMVTQDPKRYELIFMDLQMPVMGGIEATQIIHTINTEIPIIALSANAMKEDVEKSKEAGMKEHLSKPIEVEKLYRVLVQYISKKVDNVVLQEVDVSQAVTLPIFQTIDTKVGLGHVANNEKLYLKILNDFYNNYAHKDFESITDKELKIFAHTLKGLLATIGVKELTSLAKRLEESEERKLLSELQKALHPVFEELHTKLASIIEKKTPTMPLEPYKRDEIFQLLKESITHKRARDAKELLQTLQSYEVSKEDTIILQQVATLLQKRKYTSILEILE